MKLLLEQNLSRHLVGPLTEAFPGTRHVVELGLERANDEVVWQRAALDGYIVGSMDVDFYQRSILRGFPPKVVWLGLGNCATEEVLDHSCRLPEIWRSLPRTRWMRATFASSPCCRHG